MKIHLEAYEEAEENFKILLTELFTDEELDETKVQLALDHLCYFFQMPLTIKPMTISRKKAKSPYFDTADLAKFLVGIQ